MRTKIYSYKKRKKFRVFSQHLKKTYLADVNYKRINWNPSPCLPFALTILASPPFPHIHNMSDDLYIKNKITGEFELVTPSKLESASLLSSASPSSTSPPPTTSKRSKGYILIISSFILVALLTIFLNSSPGSSSSSSSSTSSPKTPKPQLREKNKF